MLAKERKTFHSEPTKMQLIDMRRWDGSEIHEGAA